RMEERFLQMEERQAARMEEMVVAVIERIYPELRARGFPGSPGGGGGGPAGQAEDHDAGQAADRARGQATEPASSQDRGQAANIDGGLGRDQAAEGEDEEVAQEDGDNNGEDGAASLTPADLRAAGERLDNDGRRNHQREGRYYCPICGACVQNLGDARTSTHFERCNIHYYQLLAEPPIRQGKRRRREG
ncbi:hypothetical protein HOY82DRAFT_547297, partial [Tuber indicum]